MESRRIALKRALSTIELFALGYSDVSSTYYFSMGVIALYSGLSLPVVMLVGSVPLWVVGLTYAELGSAIPEAGGAYYYVKHELGELPGFIAGWLLNFDQILMISYGAVSFVGYLSVIMHLLSTYPYNVFASLLIVLVLAALNIIGIKPSARFNLVLVIIDIVGVSVLLLFGLYALIHVKHRLITAPSVALPLIGLAYALRGYTGIDVIAQSTGEALRPRRSIPRAVVAICSLSTIVALSVSLLIVYSGLTKYVASNLRDPLGALAVGLFGHSPVSMYISASIALVMLLSVNAGIVDFSRNIYRMSSDNLLPATLAIVNPKFRTPHLSIIISSLVASLFVVTNDVELIAGSYGVASLIAYMLAVIALIKFKESSGGGSFSTPVLRLGDLKLPILAIIGLPVLALSLLLEFIFKPGYIIPVASWLMAGLLLFIMLRRRPRRLTR